MNNFVKEGKGWGIRIIQVGKGFFPIEAQNPKEGRREQRKNFAKTREKQFMIDIFFVFCKLEKFFSTCFWRGDGVQSNTLSVVGFICGFLTIPAIWIFLTKLGK